MLLPAYPVKQNKYAPIVSGREMINLVETGGWRTTSTPKIKTLAERHVFWVAFNYIENRKANFQLG